MINSIFEERFLFKVNKYLLERTVRVGITGRRKEVDLVEVGIWNYYIDYLGFEGGKRLLGKSLLGVRIFF